LFVANTPKTGCLFGKDGPVVIKIPITRYVGETTPSGSLTQPALLKANHVLSGFARLTLPVWDVDPPNQNGPSEVDVLTVNGNRIDPVSTLSGADGAWRLDEFMVPIEYLRFPSLSPQLGSPPDTSVAVNNIQIDIDTASPNHDLWCAGFDWAQLSFSAMAPVILVHGTNADHTSWDETPDFKNHLGSLGIPYYYQTVDIGKNSSADTNANNLCTQLNQLAVWFGTNYFNLITHSKGATDSRRFFNQNYRNPGCAVGTGDAPVPFRIQTMTSLDTPSQGTMLSDVSVATANTSFGTHSNDPNVDSLLSSSWLASYFGAPQPPALNLQTIAGMAAFNEANTVKPPGVSYFSVAADADANHDGHVNCAEAKPLLGIECAIAADTMYQVLGNITSVTIVKKTVVLQSEGLPYEQTYDFVQATHGPFMPNDLTSTVDSTHYTRDFTPILTTTANHSSVKNAATAQVVVDKIQEAFPVGLYPP
jgi:hypothetical protein